MVSLSVDDKPIGVGECVAVMMMTWKIGSVMLYWMWIVSMMVRELMMLMM